MAEEDDELLDCVIKENDILRERLRQAKEKIADAMSTASYFGFQNSNEDPGELKWALKEVCYKLGLKR
jgi:hypothetical protein